MATRDRIAEVNETVGKLAEVVGKLAESSLAADQRMDKRLEALERALAGQTRIGNKLGALASAMERNLEEVGKTREAMVARANAVAAEVRETMAGRVPRATLESPFHNPPETTGG